MTSHIVPIFNEIIALNSCNYAREYIREGTTQIINNTYELINLHSLARALSELRRLPNEVNEFSLEFDEVIRQFYNTINNCKKYSIGNCHELALMALEYVALYAPHVEAEIYCISGGDHVFLVVGRDPLSNPFCPETWGDKAYICDPWSNKVYLASEYLTEMKNFYRKEGVNFTEDFNHTKHRLKPMSMQNTAYVRRSSSEDNLEKISELFKYKSQIILSAVEVLENDLAKISSRLKDKYGDKNAKYEIIFNKTVKLQALIAEIKSDLTSMDLSQDNYCDFRINLEQKLSNQARTFVETSRTNKQDTKTLYSYSNEKSLGSLFMRFFKIPPETVRNTNEAIEKAGTVFAELKNTS